MKSFHSLALAGIGLGLTLPVGGAEAIQGRTLPLARGPYLQRATDESITIVWRTAGITQPGLRYGSSVDQLDQQAASIMMRAADGIDLTTQNPTTGPSLLGAPAGLVQYEARLTNLKPDATYCYAVYDGAQRLTPAESSFRFTTHPPRGANRPLQFWVVGDSGTGRETQTSVYNAIRNEVGEKGRPLDFMLHLGGMALSRGADVEFKSRFFDVYDLTLRQLVCWPTMGDEEGASATSTNALGPYYDAFVCPVRGEAGGVASDTEAYYSFDYGRVHFISLNSHDLDRKAGGVMARWLKRDLEQAQSNGTQWLIAFFHHPPFTKGSHDSDREKQLIEMRTQILPLLESGGVDLVLSAHSHIYERSMLVDGAYATPTTADGIVLDDGDGGATGPGYRKSAGIHPNSGAIYVVAGHGGATLARKGTVPIMRSTLVEHGSVLIDIDGATLRGRMINKFGEVRDTFTLVKQGKVEVHRVFKPWTPPPYKPATVGNPTQPPEDFKVLIPKNSEWTYLAGAHPDGFDWTRDGFSTDGWSTGPAPFGMGYAEVRTVPDKMKDRSTVLYLRHVFELSQPSTVAEIGLMINYDDGFIAYLNGHEVARRSVGQGNGANAREVRSHDAARHSYVLLSGFEKYLRSGRNVLAIEGHNVAVTSQDFLIDPYLIYER